MSGHFSRLSYDKCFLDQETNQSTKPGDYKLYYGQKNKFIHFRNGYHGDTSAAMSVCDPAEGMHFIFDKYLNRNFFCELPSNEKFKNNLEIILKKMRKA